MQQQDSSSPKRRPGQPRKYAIRLETGRTRKDTVTGEFLTLDDAPDSMTPEECARVLRMEYADCLELLRSGVIPSLRYGPRKCRIFKPALRRFMEQSTSSQ